MKKVWLVTGASKGLGRALTEELLAQGHMVAATSRDLKSLGAETEFFLPLEVDLSSETSAKAAIDMTVKKFNSLDVLVNNAGYGQGGAVEEVSDKLARANFEVNVFGLLNMIRATLPVMRERKSGHVMNISSIGGFSGNFSGFGIYCGTKFAVAGISEGLASDLAPLGIHTTLIYPGYFRTDFLSSGSFVKPDQTIAAYENAKAGLEMHYDQINHNQPGDPQKAAKVMIELAAMKTPPVHMFLGTDSYEMATEEMKNVKAEMEKMKKLSQSTNF